MLPAVYEENELGTLKVLAIFRNENTFQVVGGKVMKGLMRNGAEARIMRKEAVLAEGRIGQLQSNKQNAKEVSEGAECGLKVEGVTTILAGDSIMAYEKVLRVRHLSDLS